MSISPVRHPHSKPTTRSQSTLPSINQATSVKRGTNVATRGMNCYLVDYRYLKLSTVNELLDAQPRSGTFFRSRPKVDELEIEDQLAQQAAKKALGIYFFGDRANSRTHVTEDGIFLIKAKDENYAFKVDLAKSLIKDKSMKRFYLGDNGELMERSMTLSEIEEVESTGVLMRCTTLNLSNNLFKGEAICNMPMAIATKLYRPHLTLTLLDLSCNEISTLPTSFNIFPLRTLLLHVNKIECLEEVAKLQSIVTLRSLTLNENPVQRLFPKYKFRILFLLPFLTNFDGVRVCPKDKESLVVFDKLFANNRLRALSPLKLPAIKRN